MCHWMGHIFTTGLTIIRSHIFRFLRVRQFIFTVSKHSRMFVLQKESEVFFIQSKKWVNSLKQKVTKLGQQKLPICPKVTKMGSIIGHRIDFNGLVLSLSLYKRLYYFHCQILLLIIAYFAQNGHGHMVILKEESEQFRLFTSSYTLSQPAQQVLGCSGRKKEEAHERETHEGRRSTCPEGP